MNSSTTFFRLTALLLCAGTIVLATQASAGPREQARRLHDRLAGVPPGETVLAAMEAAIADDDVATAAALAMDNKAFWNVTLRNMVTPWTNVEQSAFEPLNDYTATVIGLVRDDADFRRVLWDDIIYTGVAASGPALPAYSNDDNAHYESLQARDLDLRDALQAQSQSAVTGLPAAATAGVMTTRAAARAFFSAGTNRRMLRFTLMNHLCSDLEQLKDNTRPPDRIRQDVSRSPGGDSKVFFGTCLACHAGMDGLAGAFAYYNYTGTADGDSGALQYNGNGSLDPLTGSRVQAKYLINTGTFPFGHITTDDSWVNYWRHGINAHVGWSGALPARGEGAKSLGRELADSDAFASCQVKKVFRTVCLRPATSAADQAEIARITGVFRSNGYRLRQVFAEAGAWCMGD